jgi:hypothetical protein
MRTIEVDSRDRMGAVELLREICRNRDMQGAAMGAWDALRRENGIGDGLDEFPKGMDRWPVIRILESDDDLETMEDEHKQFIMSSEFLDVVRNPGGYYVAIYNSNVDFSATDAFVTRENSRLDALRSGPYIMEEQRAATIRRMALGCPRSMILVRDNAVGTYAQFDDEDRWADFEAMLCSAGRYTLEADLGGAYRLYSSSAEWPGEALRETLTSSPHYSVYGAFRIEEGAISIPEFPPMEALLEGFAAPMAAQVRGAEGAPQTLPQYGDGDDVSLTGRQVREAWGRWTLASGGNRRIR